MDYLLKAENIVVKRRSKTILKDVSLTIGDHELITIVGPNGAGKSMLLKCLLGFYQPDSGVIHRKPHVTMGYVPQSIKIDNGVPIKVEQFLRLRRLCDKSTWNKVIGETGITEVLQTQLYDLSEGQLQNVLLARALLGSPNLLVLDEPAQNLDIPNQLAFYKLLEKIYQEYNISVLMVSHDLHFVMSCTKRVVCLFHHICCSGAPQVVAQDPEFVSLFGHDMARMMAVYHHSHNHVHGAEDA